MSDHQKQDIDQRRDELLRRALATPPISNEAIIQRSKRKTAQKRT